MAHYLKANLVFNWFFSILAIVWSKSGHQGDNMKTLEMDTSRDASVFLYHGEATALHCLTVGDKNVNSSAPESKGVQWTFPPDVTVVNSSKVNDDLKGPWVEITTSKTLVFHNPDKSMQAPYVCYDDSNRSTAWVKVLTREGFGAKKRTVSGLIAAGAVVAIMALGCCIAWRVARNKKYKYSTTNAEDVHDCKIVIPSIEIIDETGEKVNQTVYDFM